MLTHRLAWILLRGEIPPNYALKATCENRACVRPDHHVLVVRGGPLNDRFWSRVRKSENGCWEWIGGKKTDRTKSVSYGSICVSPGVWDAAHRVSWCLAFGEIPPGVWVLHHCDNRLCVRPDHLFLGTHTDNMSDMVAKDRSRHGERHKNARLTEQAVREMRALHATGVPHAELSARFGVCVNHVSRIVGRRAWTHVE